jgi:peptide/nickel transport system permease protein
MMLDQNENSEQLALIKRSMALTKPIYPVFIIYLNDLTLSLQQNESDYTYLSEGKCGTIIQFLQLKLVIKTYLRKVSRKAERKYLR